MDQLYAKESAPIAAPRESVRQAPGGALVRRRASRGTGRLASTGWRVNPWVKRGILLGFRFGETVDLTSIMAAGLSSTRVRCR